jgi:Tol biopolymer transport system component
MNRLFSRRRALAFTASPALLSAACGLSRSSTTSPAAGSASAAEPPALGAGLVTGKLLYAADADLWLWQNGSARRLTRDRISRQPAWSPDGKRIAHVKIDVSSSEIWVMDADGGGARQLTDNYSRALNQNNWAFRPTWWPDGSRVLYLSEATTNDLMIWQVQPDGKNRRNFLSVPDFEGGLDMPAIAPDARRLLAVSYRTAGTKPQIFSYSLPNGPWRPLTDHPDGAYDPVWSPDGARFAYVVRNKGRHDVWIASADGATAQAVTETGACRAPCWSPDGQQLAYLSSESGAFDIWTVGAPALAAPASPASPVSPVAPRRQVTKGLNADAISGLSWTK